ncbi:hypothetical protein AAEP93_010601 [Penicillium crustosum]
MNECLQSSSGGRHYEKPGVLCCKCLPQCPGLAHSWHHHPSSPAAQQLTSKGVDIVKADLDDIASLESAFHGASAIFAVTDIYNHMFNPAKFPKAQEAGISVSEYACNLETTQAMNIAITAISPAVSSPLTHFIFSSLSDTKRWSNGKYTWKMASHKQ